VTTHLGRPDRSPVPLTVLCGFDRHAVADAAAVLLLGGSRLASVWADPFTADLGYVQVRVTDSEGRCTDQAIPLQSDCPFCTLRLATALTVRRLRRTGRYDAFLIQLHPGVDAGVAIRGLAAELAGAAVVDTTALLLHPGWADDLAGDATVAEKGIAVTGDANRGAAPVLAAALTAATTVVAPSALGRVRGPAEDALLTILAPGATLLRPATPYDVTGTHLVRTGRFHLGMLDPLAVRGLLDPHVRLPAETGSLRLVRWHAQRPLHPRRLHDTLDQLADGVIRSTGYLRLATRPDQLVHWDSAGASLALGPLEPGTPAPGTTARWLTPRPAPGHPPGWAHASHVAFAGDDLDSGHIQRLLDSCLLTDGELAPGPAAWRRLPDPFAGWGDRGTATTRETA